jgi:hypothetical protein
LDQRPPHPTFRKFDVLLPREALALDPAIDKRKRPGRVATSAKRSRLTDEMNMRV